MPSLWRSHASPDRGASQAGNSGTLTAKAPESPWFQALTHAQAFSTEGAIPARTGGRRDAQAEGIHSAAYSADRVAGCRQSLPLVARRSALASASNGNDQQAVTPPSGSIPAASTSVARAVLGGSGRREAASLMAVRYAELRSRAPTGTRRGGTTWR